MQTPAPLAAPPDLQVSEAATPGASVAAVRGGDDHMLETPEFDTPGQASPTRHRSQEGGRSLGDGAAALDSSRNRSGGLHAAAVAALAEAVAAPANAAEPLSKPRLRVQGADIILEDAASPKDAAENGGGSAQRPPQDQPQLAAAAAGLPAQAPVAAAGNAGAGTSAAAQQPAALAGQPQQQQSTQPPPLNLAAMRVSQAHEHELQLRLASRTATGVSNMAIASTRPLATHPLPHGDDRCGELLMGRQGRVQSWSRSGGCAFTHSSLAWLLAIGPNLQLSCLVAAPRLPTPFLPIHFAADAPHLPPLAPLQPTAGTRRGRRRGWPRQRRQQRCGGPCAHQVPLHPD